MTTVLLVQVPACTSSARHTEWCGTARRVPSQRATAVCCRAARPKTLFEVRSPSGPDFACPCRYNRHVLISRHSTAQGCRPQGSRITSLYADCTLFPGPRLGQAAICTGGAEQPSRQAQPRQDLPTHRSRGRGSSCQQQEELVPGVAQDQRRTVCHPATARSCRLRIQVGTSDIPRMRSKLTSMPASLLLCTMSRIP